MDKKHKLKLIQKMCELTSKDSVARSILNHLFIINLLKKESIEMIFNNLGSDLMRIFIILDKSSAQKL